MSSSEALGGGGSPRRDISLHWTAEVYSNHHVHDIRGIIGEIPLPTDDEEKHFRESFNYKFLNTPPTPPKRRAEINLSKIIYNQSIISDKTWWYLRLMSE